MIINNIRMHHVDLWLVQKKKKKLKIVLRLKSCFRGIQIPRHTVSVGQFLS